MADWVKKTLKLKDDHGWTAKPGFKIFVADRGAVRFDIPKDWVIIPEEDGTIAFHDREPPDDDCTLKMTVFYLRDDVDWSQLPLARIVEDLLDKGNEEKVEVIERGKVIEVKRHRLHLAWGETRYIDPEGKREARTRICLAKWENVQPLITFSFWAKDSPRLGKAWDELIRSMDLCNYIEDPTRRVLDI